MNKERGELICLSDSSVAVVGETTGREEAQFLLREAEGGLSGIFSQNCTRLAQLLEKYKAQLGEGGSLEGLPEAMAEIEKMHWVPDPVVYEHLYRILTQDEMMDAAFDEGHGISHSKRNCIILDKRFSTTYLAKKRNAYNSFSGEDENYLSLLARTRHADCPVEMAIPLGWVMNEMLLAPTIDDLIAGEDILREIRECAPSWRIEGIKFIRPLLGIVQRSDEKWESTVFYRFIKGLTSFSPMKVVLALEMFLKNNGINPIDLRNNLGVARSTDEFYAIYIYDIELFRPLV